MAKKIFSKGDVVDLTEWDRSERPANRLGQCIITDIYRAVSETGYICDVKSISYTGRSHCGLDQNWLKMVSPSLANKPAVDQV